MDAPLQRARLLRIRLSAPTRIRSTNLPRKRMSRVAPSAADRTHARVHADSDRAWHRRPHWIHFPVGRSCVVLPPPYQTWDPPQSLTSSIYTAHNLLAKNEAPRRYDTLPKLFCPPTCASIRSPYPCEHSRSASSVARALTPTRPTDHHAVDRLRRHRDSRFKRRCNVCDQQRRRGV